MLNATSVTLLLTKWFERFNWVMSGVTSVGGLPAAIHQEDLFRSSGSGRRRSKNDASSERVRARYGRSLY